MDKSLRGRFSVIAVLVVLLSVIFTSGCVGVMDPTPKELNIRGNTICVDSEYISDTLIWGLCFDPNTYDDEIVNAVDKYMPTTNPVIEVGASFGTLSAYVNDKLVISTDQISVEPNPYLIPCLNKTKQLNGLGCTFVQKAVAYGSDTVEISVSKTVLNNEIVNSNKGTETVKVSTTTIQQLAESSAFSSKTNLTVIMDVNGIEHTIIQRETAFFRDNVGTVIVAVNTENKNTPDTFAYIMNNLGFEQKSNVFDDTSKSNIMVFQK